MCAKSLRIPLLLYVIPNRSAISCRTALFVHPLPTFVPAIASSRNRRLKLSTCSGPNSRCPCSPAPLRIILQPAQPALVILLHPPPDRLLIHQQNPPHLAIAIPLMHQDQGMIPLAFMPIHFHVLIASHGFLIILVT